MNKNLIKKLILIAGIFISLFSIFLDAIFRNNFYFGASQLILLLVGITLIVGYWSTKILIWMIGLVIGINLVILNKEYFKLINESPVVKENIQKIDKEIVELVIDKRFNEIEKFILLSESYVDQNQFQKYFSYKNKDSLNFIKKDKPEYLKNNINLIKKEISQNYFLNYKDLISQDLNLKIIKEIKYEKYNIIVFEWNAFNGNKAIGNIYLPKDIKKEYPIVFSIPGCGENLWSDYPQQTNPQHRLGLLANNQIISATTIATCSNSEFTPNARYEILSDISNGKLNDEDIAIIIWLRFLKIYKEFDFFKVDEEKIGITGYSNGASIIKRLLRVNDDIKYVSLVGTTIRPSKKKEKKFFSFPAERIVESENENFYFSDGAKQLNKITYEVYNKFKIKNDLVLTNLLTFYHDRKFQIIIGRKDTAISNAGKAFLKDEIKNINKYNKLFFETNNIILVENEMDHNFSNENNTYVVRFFNKNLNNKNNLDLEFNYKKNDKENLYPKKSFFDLKKLHLKEFNRNINQDKKINLENIKNIFKINKLNYTRPILLLSKEISIGDTNITAKLYTQKLDNEIHGYFYEFENKNMNNKVSNIFLYSKKDFDLEMLLKSIKNSNITYLNILPGYGILNAKFTTTGNLAKFLMNSNHAPSLAGLALQSVINLEKFSKEKYGSKFSNYYSFGPESNFITLIYNKVSNNSTNIELYEHLKIESFFSDKNIFGIPAIFFVKGLDKIYNEFLQIKLNEINAKIMSFGDLENYRVYN